MKNLLKFSILLVVTVFFASCNQGEKLDAQIYDQKFTKDNVQELLDKVTNDKSISREKMDILTAGITRLSSMNRDTIIGKSLNEVINIEEDFLKQRSIATLNTQGVKVNLVLNHEFKFVGLMPRDTLDKSFNIIVIEITNNGKSEMANMQGNLQFYDPNGQVVKSYPITIKNALNGEKIAAGTKKRVAIPYTHDKNNLRDEMMRNDIKNMRAIWVATMIEWADGSQISVQAVNSK